MLILCNVNTGIVSRDNVKRAIKTQLQGDIVAGKFDIGIVSGGNVISIRSGADMKEWLTFEWEEKLYSGAMA